MTNNQNTTSATSKIATLIGKKNGKEIYESRTIKNVVSYTVRQNGIIVDSFDKGINDQLPARFIPER